MKKQRADDRAGHPLFVWGQCVPFQQRQPHRKPQRLRLAVLLLYTKIKFQNCRLTQTL